MSSNKYSFTIVFKPYERKNTLNDIRTIYSGKTCIVAKNSKHGSVYLHKNAKIIRGQFYKVAGSVRHPILQSKDDVHIRVTDFHSKADIKAEQHQNTIFVTDCNYE